MEKVVVIGLGLIGGSLALDIRHRGAYTISGIDTNPVHVNRAKELGIIDAEGSFDQLEDASIVIVAVPVDMVEAVVLKVLDGIGDSTLVFDVGSVKEQLCKAVANHPKRENFVAAHPLAGTEFSGPDAAIRYLFDGKVNIICEPEKSDWKILDKAFSLFKLLQMRIKMMQPAEHDRHIAYVSHLSHVSSFMLGKTVLDLEKNEQHIFDMASTGFASTVRLAKSSPNMWAPIFMENKENVLEALNGYIANLQDFKKMIENEDREALKTTMDDTNYIKKVLKGIKE